MVFRGLVDPDRALEYLEALINYVSSAELDRGLALKLASRLEELAERLRRCTGGVEG